MHILHINPDYPYQGVFLRFLKYLEQTSGDFHTMYVPLPQGRPFTHIYDCSTNHVEVVYSYDFNKFDRLLYVRRCSKIAKALGRPMRFGSPDIIHCHYLFNSGYVAYKIKQKTGTKYIVTARNSDVNDYFKLSRYIPQLQKIGLKVMLDAEYIIFPSPAYRKKVAEEHVPKSWRDKIANKAFVIPNGISDFWIKNKPSGSNKRRDSEIRALFVGEWTKNKNIETVVKVIIFLRSKGYNASILIVGDGPNREMVLKLAARHPDFVFTHGWVKDPNELLRIYRSCDIFIMPSFTETFGLVYVEAMSQGLPVIYSRGEGIDGYFDDGVIGYGCDPRRPDHIAQAVERIMNDYQNISKNSIEAAQRFNWADITKEYNRIYNSISQNQDR